MDQSHEWVPGDQVPSDPDLANRLVRSIEGISAVWLTVNPDGDGHGGSEILPCPVAIITFMLRDGSASTVVLTTAGVATLNEEIAGHISGLLGGVEPIDGRVLDDGLTRMIDEEMKRREDDSDGDGDNDNPADDWRNW